MAHIEFTTGKAVISVLLRFSSDLIKSNSRQSDVVSVSRNPHTLNRIFLPGEVITAHLSVSSENFKIIL